MISLSPESAERQIILLASRPQLSKATGAELAELCGSGVDWSALHHMANLNGVAHLIYRNVRTLDFVPPEWKEKLRRGYLTNAARNMLLARDLHRVSLALEHAGVAHLTFKGAVLSKLAYDDLAARYTSDVDILVDPPKVHAAIEVLERLGFESGYRMSPHERQYWIRTDCEMPFVDSKTRTVIDLHWAFTSGHMPFRLHAVDVLARSVAIEIDRTVVPTLTHADNVVLLANHGAKHMWDRLEWIATFSAVADAAATDWEEVRRVASKAGALTQLQLAVYLARSLYGLKSEAALAGISPKRLANIGRLSAFVFGRLFRDRDELSTIELAPLQPLIHDSRVVAYRALLRWLLMPMVADQDAVKLPAALAPLHWVFRPVRIASRALKSLVARVGPGGKKSGPI